MAMAQTAEFPYEEGAATATGGFQDETLPQAITLNVHGGGGRAFAASMGIEDDGQLPNYIIDAMPRARLSEEEKFAREIARRRESELERRKRIYDGKCRAIGLDVPKLDQQCQEKAESRAAAAKEARAYDAAALRTGKQLEMMEIQKQQVRKDLTKECKNVSLQTLNFESRREYDLNDPLLKRKERPARVGDDDARCGPSSMQQFGGEDLMKGERTRQQRKAQADWIEQQIFEKNMLKAMNSGEDARYAAEVKEITNLRNEIEESEVSLRRDLNQHQQADNTAKAREEAEKARQEGHLGNVLNAQELAFHAQDHFLNETGAYHNPNGRLRRDAYKGSSAVERVAVRDLQQEQVMDKYSRKRQEKAEDMMFAAQSEATRRQLILMERDKQRVKRANAEEQKFGNLDLQGQQSQANRDRELANKNEVGAGFYSQFGVGVR